MAVSQVVIAAKYKASKSSVRIIGKRLHHYFPDSPNLLIKRLARQIAAGKQDNFYFANTATIITDGIYHLNDKDNYLPDGIKSISLPKEVKACQSVVVMRRFYAYFLEYDCRIADGAVQSVRLTNTIDLQSGAEVAYQPLELLLKIARKRYKKDEHLAGLLVQYIADAYHISDYAWEMFNVITYNLIRYVFDNEKLEMVGGTHLVADIERVAKQANLPTYLLADFLKIEKLAKLYVRHLNAQDELSVIDERLRNNLANVAYTVAEIWRENLGDKQHAIPPTNSMILVMHEELVRFMDGE
ncbi:MAG: hypothetical protein OYH77_00885 [Pseudomonadota bacterium]|nr:hypothetical protein [Pseudomonadota bacterium]